VQPENLLLLAPEEGKGDFIKIADFGLSKGDIYHTSNLSSLISHTDFGAEQLQTACGTPDYVGMSIHFSYLIVGWLS
jgi:hypothetical protein